ncbi:unnamed protein product, partial [Callosobruchus maculatus]
MVTPYFSKLCHGHPCLLNAPYLNCRSKNRGTQSFELPHNGLLTLFPDGYNLQLFKSNVHRHFYSAIG